MFTLNDILDEGLKFQKRFFHYLLSYVNTRHGTTSIIDATAWGWGVEYCGAVNTRRDVAMI